MRCVCVCALVTKYWFLRAHAYTQNLRFVTYSRLFFKAIFCAPMSTAKGRKRCRSRSRSSAILSPFRKSCAYECCCCFLLLLLLHLSMKSAFEHMFYVFNYIQICARTIKIVDFFLHFISILTLTHADTLAMPSRCHQVMTMSIDRLDHNFINLYGFFFHFI